tara:strand:- start:86 stop:1132 length:1047 start_codon:yes stop_codon:yes gene_type:complete
MTTTNYNVNNILNNINNESKKIKYTELYGSDVLFTIIAVIITIAISIYFIILINFKKYHKAWKDNENNIRCNPIYMPFSRYISSGPLFSNPISSSENFKYCVDGISTNITGEYNTDFTSIFSNVENLYNFITDSMTTLVTVLAAIKELFMQLVKTILGRFVMLSDIMTELITKAFTAIQIFPALFSVFWSVLLQFVTVIKYIMIYLINLLYKCILGPVGSLVGLTDVWSSLLIIFFIIANLYFWLNLPFGGWQVFLAALILFAVLIAILFPIVFFVKYLFIILFTIITKINQKVMQFIYKIDTGIYIHTPKFDAMRTAYLSEKEEESRRNLFSPPSFDDCKNLFKKKD